MGRRAACWLGLLVFSAAVFYRPLTQVVGSSFNQDQYSQVLIIPPICAALLILERRRIVARQSYSVAGAVLFAACIATYVLLSLAHLVQEPSIQISVSILLFCVSCAAAFLACYGQAALRAGLFPWCFLVLMTPLPDAVHDRVVVFLQHGSAVLTDWFFTASTIPFSRDGVVISLPTVTIEVARECSGIRSSVVLVLVGIVLGQLFLKRFWSKAALVLFLVPMTLIKNAIRIFTLSTLGMYVDQSFLTGRLHHQGGIVFFILALAVLWAAVWVLQKLEARQAGEVVPAPHGSDSMKEESL